MKLKILFSIIFVLPFSNTYAQTCCSGGIPLSNSLGLPISEKGTIQLGINYDYNNLNTLNTGTEKLDDNARLRITHSVLLNASYAITNNFSFEGLFTWVNQRRKITQFGNENLDQSSGIGDGVLLLKYNFKNLIGSNSSTTLGIGTKIPLGSSTEKNNEGITLNADLQPGSNTWDVIYWGAASKNFAFRPTLTFSARVTYRTTGENNNYLGDLTYKFGNEFQTFASFSDQFLLLNSLVNPSISLKYRTVSKDQINDFDLENTGGDWLSIIPNFSINLTPNISFSSKIELPLYSNVDGTQLTPSYRLTTGILIKLNPKNELILN